METARQLLEPPDLESVPHEDQAVHRSEWYDELRSNYRKSQRGIRSTGCFTHSQSISLKGEVTRGSDAFNIDFCFQYEILRINTPPNYQKWAKNVVLIFSI